MDLTIIIAHRGPHLGLWATIESCANELQDSGFDYNFVVVGNGEKLNADQVIFKRILARYGKLLSWTQHEQPLSPPLARQIGAEIADGKILFFFDNHCLPQRGYFTRAMHALKRDDIDILHGTTARVVGFRLEYHLTLLLESQFWGMKSFFPQDSEHPYKIAMGDHGGFAVKRNVWQEIGGYWSGFVGWGGEEPYFSLKSWLLGKTVWLDPKMIFSHFCSERNYARCYSNDFYLNMLMAANIIGGQKWLQTVAESFAREVRFVTDNEKKTVNDLINEAQERSQPHADWLAQNRKQSLDEFLSEMDSRGIAY